MPTLRSRSLMAALVVVLLPLGAAAQRRPAAEQTAPSQQPAPAEAPVAGPQVSGVPAIDAQALRQQFREVMQAYPPALSRVLKLDPLLMQNESYLAQYPALAGFLNAHPEIAHNPSYFFEHVYIPGDPEPLDARSQSIRMGRDMMEGIGSFAIAVFVAALFAWFVRTFIDYRRWLRVSRIQTEVHSKLLDRFAGSGDLMAYVHTPAGRRFLESAPIPLDPTPRAIGAPLGRILWSIQAGVVLTVGGLGFKYIGTGLIDELAQPLSLVGVLAIAFGLGFILSGVISYVLSRKLGLIEPAPPAPAERVDTAAS